MVFRLIKRRIKLKKLLTLVLLLLSQSASGEWSHNPWENDFHATFGFTYGTKIGPGAELSLIPKLSREFRLGFVIGGWEDFAYFEGEVLYFIKQTDLFVTAGIGQITQKEILTPHDSAYLSANQLTLSAGSEIFPLFPYYRAYFTKETQHEFGLMLKMAIASVRTLP
jgi:hypothetical protein